MIRLWIFSPIHFSIFVEENKNNSPWTRIPSQKSCLEKRKKEKQLNRETVKARTVHNYFHLVPIGWFIHPRGVENPVAIWRTGSKPFPGLLTAHVFASVSKHWQFIRARKGGKPDWHCDWISVGFSPPPMQDRSRSSSKPISVGFLCLFVGVFSVVRLLASVTAHSPPRIYRIAYSRSVHPMYGRNVCAFRDHPGKWSGKMYETMRG